MNYKFADAKQAFDKLDSFIHARARRYINRNKNSKDRQANYILTNQVLKELKLKSLKTIYQKYALKNKGILKKIRKNRIKTGQRKTRQLPESAYIPVKYQLNYILSELNKLTGLIRKLENKVDEIDRKLDVLNANFR